MQITRLASLTESQFLGCVSAFVETLSGEMNSAAMFLRKLAGGAKGAAFAFEMSLDRHRYGGLTVLDRWGTFMHAFGPHLDLSRYRDIIEDASRRMLSAEGILRHANEVMDAAEIYANDVVEACVLAFQSVTAVFDEERKAAEQYLKLGPMLPPDFHEARAMFLRDLAAR